MQAGTKALLVAVVGVVALVIAVLSWGGDDSTPVPEGDSGPVTERNEPAEAASLEGESIERPASEEGRTAVETGVAGAAAGKIALTGRLVLEGAPLPGVDVRFAGGWFPGMDALDVELPDGVDPGVVTSYGQLTETTDADGRFRFELEAKKGGSVRVVSEDYVLAKSTAGRIMIKPSATDVDLGDLPVDHGATLSGVVQDTAGLALEGVEVSLARGDDTSGFFSRMGGNSTATDASGRFEFRGLSAASYTISTASPQHLPERTSVELTPGGRRDDVVLTLSYGATIRGRVVDDLGRAIADAQVGAFRTRTDGGMTVQGLSQGETVRTDANGEFVLGGIQNAAVTVRAWHEDHQAGTSPNIAKGATDVVLRLSRFGRIEGILVDDQGKGVEGSRVQTASREPGMAMFMQRRGESTDADGAFVLEKVEPGPLRVIAKGDGHVDVEAEVEVRPGETIKGVRLVAARGSAIVATVVDHNGDPVEGARVQVREPPAQMPAGMRFETRSVERRVEDGHEDVFIHGGPSVLGEGVTDANGEVTIAGLHAGEVAVSARHKQYAPAIDAVLTLPATGSADTELTLRQAGAVSVRVLDTNREPVADATVAIVGPEGLPEEKQKTGKTDANGELTLDQLIPGTYTGMLQLPPRARSFGNASIVIGDDGTNLEQTRTPFRVVATETSSLELIQPVLTTLTGLLLDSSGPVSGGKVSVSKADGTEDVMASLGGGYSAKTGPDGRFSIPDLPAGSYVIRYGRKSQTVKAEETLDLHGEAEVDRNLRLRGGTVRVAVFDENGDPIRKAKVRVEREASSSSPSAPRPRAVAMVTLDANGGGGGEQSMSFGPEEPVVSTDEDGIAEVKDVPPGKYQVSVSHSRFVTEKLDPIEVFTDQVRDLGSVTLGQAGVIRGALVAKDGDPPMVANVELRRLGDTDSSDTTMAMRGAFRFTGVKPGRYAVRAMGIGPSGTRDWGPEQEVEVTAGRTADVKVTLE